MVRLSSAKPTEEIRRNNFEENNKNMPLRAYSTDPKKSNVLVPKEDPNKNNVQIITKNVNNYITNNIHNIIISPNFKTFQEFMEESKTNPQTKSSELNKVYYPKNGNREVEEQKTYTPTKTSDINKGGYNSNFVPKNIREEPPKNPYLSDSKIRGERPNSQRPREQTGYENKQNILKDENLYKPYVNNPNNASVKTEQKPKVMNSYEQKSYQVAVDLDKNKYELDKHKYDLPFNPIQRPSLVNKGDKNQQQNLFKNYQSEGKKTNPLVLNPNPIQVRPNTGKQGPVKLQDDGRIDMSMPRQMYNISTVKKNNFVSNNAPSTTTMKNQPMLRQNSRERNERPSTAPSKNDLTSPTNKPMNHASTGMKRLPSPNIKSNNILSHQMKNPMNNSTKIRSQSPMTMMSQNRNISGSFKGPSTSKLYK